MSKEFNKLPSEILNIEDEYIAYCFNEACFNILMRIKNKEKPNYRKFEIKEKQEKMQHNYRSFKDFYKDYSGG